MMMDRLLRRGRHTAPTCTSQSAVAQKHSETKYVSTDARVSVLRVQFLSASPPRPLPGVRRLQ